MKGKITKIEYDYRQEKGTTVFFRVSLDIMKSLNFRPVLIEHITSSGGTYKPGNSFKLDITDYLKVTEVNSEKHTVYSDAGLTDTPLNDVSIILGKVRYYPETKEKMIKYVTKILKNL